MHFSPQPKKFTRSFCFDGCGECTFILIGWTSPVREIVVFILSFPAQLVEVFVCFLPLCEFSAHCVFVIFLLALFGSMGNSCVKLAWVHPLDFCIQTLDANFKVYFSCWNPCSNLSRLAMAALRVISDVSAALFHHCVFLIVTLT